MHTLSTPPQPGQCRPLCNVIITSCCAAPPEECSGANRFQCDSGECIPISSRCDGYISCVDNSDEKHCRKLTVIVRVVVMVMVMVVVVQPNTLESNVLMNFFSSSSPGLLRSCFPLQKKQRHLRCLFAAVLSSGIALLTLVWGASALFPCFLTARARSWRVCVV